jgi:hypothetical protein
MHVLASDAFSAARWQFGEIAASGVPPGEVDAGMEWVAYHATGLGTPYAPARPGQMWYTGYWPSYRQCAIVTSWPNPREGYVLLLADRRAYRKFRFDGPALPLFIDRSTGTSCP